MTAATHEPIAALIARSSLGTRQVRALTAGTPAPVIRHVLAHLATSMQHPARRSRPPAIYSIPVHHPLPIRPDRADDEGATMATRRTSATAAKAASKVLRDGRTSTTSKTAAGSALSQRAARAAKHK